MLDVDGRIQIPAAELAFTFARSSGPGGQNVNKVHSKAVLKWSPTRSASIPDAMRRRFLARYGSRLTKDGDLVLASDRFRDRPRNMEDCRRRLADMLRSVLNPPKPRRPTKPTRASKERRLAAKRQRSETKSRRRGLDE